MEVSLVDIFIVGIILYFGIKGFRDGAAFVLASFVAFAGSLYLSFRFTPQVSQFIIDMFSIQPQWAVGLSYVMLAFGTEMIIAYLVNVVLNRIPYKLRTSKINQVLGVIFSCLNALLLITFFSYLIMLLPTRGNIKEYLQSSVIVPKLIEMGHTYGGEIITDVQQSAKDISKFLTVKPASNERITLDGNVTQKQLNVDEKTENLMISLVNKERSERGLTAVILDTKMRDVARSYSSTMLLGKFFSHIDNEGHDAGYRLDKGGVSFLLAGENLAYAPDLMTAHEGLMNSEGHKRNILDPRFSRIGIGVIDAGPWGKMFTQVFAD